MLKYSLLTDILNRVDCIADIIRQAHAAIECKQLAKVLLEIYNLSPKA